MYVRAYYSRALAAGTVSHSRGRACVGEAAELPLRAQLARALLPQPIAAPTAHAAQRGRTIASCCGSSPCASRTAGAPSTVSSKAGTSSTSTPTPRRLTARPMAAGRACTPAGGPARLHQRAESAADGNMRQGGTTRMWGAAAYRLGGGGGRVVALPPVAVRTKLAISATPRAPTASTPSSKYDSAGSTDAAYLRCICATRIGPQCSEGAAGTRSRRWVTKAARRRVARTGRPARLRAAEWTAGRPRTRRPAPTPQQCARRRAAAISAVDENRTHSWGGGSAANVRRSSPLQASKLQRCTCAPWQGRPQAVREGSRTAQPH